VNIAALPWLYLRGVECESTAQRPFERNVMHTISVANAQHQLDEIIDNLPAEGEIVLTRDDQPVAVLRAAKPVAPEAPKLGTLRGTILRIAPDFDDVPEGFEDYVP
jgi:antitoxin (DNA-binding transcriptional repressor) of toxin-antitoxin stability system